MAFIEGQGILGRITFRDGTVPAYNRTYLIVLVDTDYIKVLNVSSVHGKEHKLAFPSNEKLKVYRPPFMKPSFVKLDSLTTVPDTEWNNLILLHGGQPLDNSELARIKNLIQ